MKRLKSLVVYDAVSPPLEANEMQSATPSEDDMKVMSSLEASVNVGSFESRKGEHFIPMRIPNIPIVAIMTKKEEINPFGGPLGLAFQKNLIPCKSVEKSFGCQVTLSDLMSEVTPSSKDELLSVLFML